MTGPDQVRTLGAADENDAAPIRHVIDLITGAWRTQAVHAAVRLDLPDHVRDGHRSDEALADRTETGVDHIGRLMSLLVALGLFERDTERQYQLTDAGAQLLRDAPGSLRDMCLLHGEEFYAAWGHAHDAVAGEKTTGFALAYGQECYAYLQEHNDVAKRFQRALRASNQVVCDAAPHALDFAGKRIIDVGGGNGALLAAVLRAVPDATGQLVDLPHMAEIAKGELADFLGDRAEVRSGDMFESVPEGGDVYLLSRVLGDWGDEDCERILTNCRRAMSASSRLIVIERFVTDRPGMLLPQLWDVHLMVINGGRQRIFTGVEQLVERAGFRLAETVDLPLETTALVLEPSGA
ncbi:methyltransferase [Saccharopolyspora taberi]|uniref:Phenazine-1-carboxylate N-methyltransferase PhzM n=1 Tax=Saccharopolyspora taberi TaxID=60895 RepID=A0ABN3VG22_9PSEU